MYSNSTRYFISIIFSVFEEYSLTRAAAVLDKRVIATAFRGCPRGSITLATLNFPPNGLHYKRTYNRSRCCTQTHTRTDAPHQSLVEHLRVRPICLCVSLIYARARGLIFQFSLTRIRRNFWLRLNTSSNRAYAFLFFLLRSFLSLSLTAVFAIVHVR